MDARSLDESVRARIRAAQLQAVFRYTPLVMGVNLANGVLMVLIIRPTANRWALGLWAFVLAVAVSLAMRAWVASRGRAPRLRASIRGFHHATVHAGVLALLWAAVPIAWFPSLDAQAQLVVAAVVTGMICAGGFALATVPTAAVTYVVVLSVGAFIGVMQSDTVYRLELSGLLLAYGGVVVRSASGMARLFIERFVAEIDLTERGQVIALLLAEFEDGGSDWLFELDDELRVTKHSPRFAEVCHLPSAVLTGTAFTELVAPVGRAAFLERIRLGKPFRDLELAALGPDASRWWSVGASPIHTDRGILSGWRGVGSDTTDVKNAQDKIAWMARTDLLTGLPNRSAFRELAAAALLTARVHGTQIAVGCLDLDHFKAVNDTLGHAAGDCLLREVAHDLLAFAEQGVSVGRLGGDEFGLLFQGHDTPATVAAVAAAIVRTLSRGHEIQGAMVTVGASIGLAFGPADGDAVDTLVRNADLALYRSKSGARGGVRRYSASMLHEAEAQRELSDDLTLALDRHEFVLYYQPIADARTGATVAFEALVRWQHPTRGLLMPDTFVPVAEASGLIGPLGEWILREACRTAAGWPAGVRVAVNVSPAQIGGASLLPTVTAALADAGLAARRLEVEITEALFLSHEAGTLQFLREMRALGVSVALDDFGTGFSSLNYLTRYPVDKIKIDRSFVSGSASAHHRGAIIEAVTTLAGKLGLETTAEGVETAETLAWVTRLGCTQVQGYLLARPMPAAQVAAYLAREPVAAPAGAPDRNRRMAEQLIPS